jgi:hypothetical protein
LNGLIRALQDTFIAFGLQHKHLDSNALQPFQFPIDFQADITDRERSEFRVRGSGERDGTIDSWKMGSFIRSSIVGTCPNPIDGPNRPYGRIAKTDDASPTGFPEP